MKAAILPRYDKNTTGLEVRDIPIPTPAADEVLVRIHTAAVNPLDNMISRGEVKMITPYTLPLVMGNEFSGVVEEVGASVRAFEVGDRVYGRMPLAKIGAFAEYAAVEAGALAHVPEYLSLEEAATVPLTALTAMQAFELMNAKPGQTVFTSGGTGSLGAMAIPVAKSLGLTVATNGNGMNEERVRALGADVFIDYKKQNYTDVLADVDLVLEPWATASYPASSRSSKRAAVSCRCVECPTAVSRAAWGCPGTSACSCPSRAASTTPWPRANTRPTISSSSTRTALSWRTSPPSFRPTVR